MFTEYQPVNVCTLRAHDTGRSRTPFRARRRNCGTIIIRKVRVGRWQDHILKPSGEKLPAGSMTMLQKE